MLKLEIYVLDPEFIPVKTHTDGRTDGQTDDGLSVILGFAPALNEPLRNNYLVYVYLLYVFPAKHQMSRAI